MKSSKSSLAKAVTPNKNFTGQKNLNNISLTIIIIGSDRNEKERKKSYQKKGRT